MLTCSGYFPSFQVGVVRSTQVRSFLCLRKFHREVLAWLFSRKARLDYNVSNKLLLSMGSLDWTG